MDDILHKAMKRVHVLSKSESYGLAIYKAAQEFGLDTSYLAQKLAEKRAANKKKATPQLPKKPAVSPAPVEREDWRTKWERDHDD